MSSRLIIKWTQGSVDIIPIDSISIIRLYKRPTNYNVLIIVPGSKPISFDFYDSKDIVNLSAYLKHAEKYNYDVIIDLKTSKIYESKNGAIV